MAALLQMINDWLLRFSEIVSVELFVIVGGFLEELIAPIPSPLVLGTAGSLAEVSGMGVWFVLWLAVLGSLAKLIASLIIYVVVDKFEDVFMGRFGKFFGVTHEDIEKIGRKLGESWWGNFGVLFLLRSLPMVSSALVSVMSGFVKIEMKAYVMATFLGNIVRNLFFLLVGYYGLEGANGLLDGLSSLESIFKFVLVFLVVVGFLFFKFRKKDEK